MAPSFVSSTPEDPLLSVIQPQHPAQRHLGPLVYECAIALVICVLHGMMAWYLRYRICDMVRGTVVSVSNLVRAASPPSLLTSLAHEHRLCLRLP